MKQKNQGWFWVHGLLLLVLLIGLVRIAIASRGLLFTLELLGFLVLLTLSVASIAWYGSSWSRWSLFALFTFYVINLLLLWLVQGKLYLILVILALAGLFVSLPHQKKAEKKAAEPKAEEPHSMVFDTAKSAEPKPDAKKATVTFSPGKYVASKNSNVYHTPTCDWAKKIAKSRQVWFPEKKEAWAKGYKKHSCLQ